MGPRGAGTPASIPPTISDYEWTACTSFSRAPSSSGTRASGSSTSPTAFVPTIPTRRPPSCCGRPFLHFPKGTVHLIALNTNTTEDYVHRVMELAHVLRRPRRRYLPHRGPGTRRPAQHRSPASIETFERHVFVQVARHLAQGGVPAAVATVGSAGWRANGNSPSSGRDYLQARLLHVDRYGNLITNIDQRTFLRGGEGPGLQDPLAFCPHGPDPHPHLVLRLPAGSASPCSTTWASRKLPSATAPTAMVAESHLFGFGVGDTLRIEFEPGPATGNLLSTHDPAHGPLRTSPAEAIPEFLDLFESHRDAISSQPGCRAVHLIQSSDAPERIGTVSSLGMPRRPEAYRQSALSGTVWPATKALFSSKPVAREPPALWSSHSKPIRRRPCTRRNCARFSPPSSGRWSSRSSRW